MGEHDIRSEADGRGLRDFTHKLLTDLRALEQMLRDGVIESGVTRIGAEQELFLVGDDFRPAPLALEVLEDFSDPRLTTELGKFNLEFNLDPIPLGGDCLRRMERDLVDLLEKVRAAARAAGARVVLTGILPTLEVADLDLDNMTPMPRYYALNKAMFELRGGRFDFRIKGRDELILKHDNVMLEACNTSFQVHFQVSPENFARRYNIAQAVTAPVLAIATNSPMLFGKQLWRETRIALFQQSVDTRAPTAHLRESSPRVSFGRSWVKESALEIFQEDLARFKVVMTREVGEDPFECLSRGEAPRLDALRLHNGTVYRWNRPCYGISDGKPHLRIENRVLPAGPTPVDEMANAAFWFGLLRGVDGAYGDVTRVMTFEQARENFVKASRLGMAAHLDWPERRNVPVQELILDELVPLAREGLDGLGIDGADSGRYLDIIEERARSLKTGSRWIVDSFDSIHATDGASTALTALVSGTIDRQAGGDPVHAWTLAEPGEAGDQRRHFERVEQIMTRDLFTVHRDELVDMAAYVMDWKHIRHVPVEDHKHRLVGLVTHRALLRQMAESSSTGTTPSTAVSKIMRTDVITVRPDTRTLDALRLMRQSGISCLPVVEDDDRLVGIVTERDFMGIANELLEDYLA